VCLGACSGGPPVAPGVISSTAPLSFEKLSGS
jgi:hypothetical protein